MEVVPPAKKKLNITGNPPGACPPGRSNRSLANVLQLFKVALKNFAIFIEKYLCWGLFLIKLIVSTPCKYCEIFKSNFCYRTRPLAASTQVLPTTTLL